MGSSENISEITQRRRDSAREVILVFLAFSCLWFLWHSFRNGFVYHLQWLETWCYSVGFRMWSIKDLSERGFLWEKWWWLIISQRWARPSRLSLVARDLIGSTYLSLLALCGWEWWFSSWLRESWELHHPSLVFSPCSHLFKWSSCGILLSGTPSVGFCLDLTDMKTQGTMLTHSINTWLFASYRGDRGVRDGYPEYCLRGVRFCGNRGVG